MKRDSSAPGGFSLLEVLVAVAVLALALVTILGVCLGMQETLLRCREMDAVAALATAKLVELERVGPRNWQTNDGDFGPGKAQWKWHVDLQKNLPGGMILATVTVTLPGGRPSSLRIDKLLTP